MCRMRCFAALIAPFTVSSFPVWHNVTCCLLCCCRVADVLATAPGGAYRALRQERTNAKKYGKRQKKAREAAEAAANKKDDAAAE